MSLFSTEQLPEVSKDNALRLMVEKLKHIDEITQTFQNDLVGQYEEAIRYFQGAYPERYNQGLEGFQEIVVAPEGEKTVTDTKAAFHQRLSHLHSDAHQVEKVLPMQADEITYEILLKEALRRRRSVAADVIP